MCREAVRSASVEVGAVRSDRPVVVVWLAGLVCREAVRSASFVVVVWSAERV